MMWRRQRFLTSPSIFHLSTVLGQTGLSNARYPISRSQPASTSRRKNATASGQKHIRRGKRRRIGVTLEPQSQLAASARLEADLNVPAIAQDSAVTGPDRDNRMFAVRSALNDQF